MSISRRQLVVNTLATSAVTSALVSTAANTASTKASAGSLFDTSKRVHPGATGFNVEDRLAIVNLCNAYASGYDADDFERWRMQFVTDPVCTIYNAGTETIRLVGDDFRKAFETFRANATQKNIQPLHCSSNLTIKEQTEQTAIAEMYMLYIPFRHEAQDDNGIYPGALNTTGTSRYRFQLIKGDDNAWRIAEYRISFDQAVVQG
jgi:3-phenylpropionate/cinnamic acid dioxygenase small subunit